MSPLKPNKMGLYTRLLSGKLVMPLPIRQPNLTRKLAARDGYEQLYWPLSTSQTRSRMLGKWPSMQAYRK
jgi:hypothetical protein